MCPRLRRGPLRDGLLTAIGCAANLELPDWPALVDLVEAAIARLTRALALVEGGETPAEHEAALADLEHSDGLNPGRRLPDWTVLLERREEER